MNPARLKVFAYGTLKPGEANYKIYCQGKTIAETPAYTRGELYNLALGYPGLVKGNRKIAGYLLEFTDERILENLDKLEGYQENRTLELNQYYRQEVGIYDCCDRFLCLAWCYFMTPAKIAQFQGELIVANNWIG